MAVTKGHGNPPWSRDEVILALDLYFDCEGQIPGISYRKVIELSEFLRSLPSTTGVERKSSFRNPDGVVFKLQNLRQVATGRGFSNTSKIDREVWRAFGSDREEVRRLAKLIRENAALVDVPALAEEMDVEFSEGRIVTRIHARRERNLGLRRKLLDRRRSLGALACDMCARASKSFSPSLGDAVFECHHLVPLSEAGDSKTKIRDLALLCANCHRLIHRAIANSGKWLSLDEARVLLAITPASTP